jgi:threonine dehydrogenase-like Zn-dependent dehydrogenase
MGLVQLKEIEIKGSMMYTRDDFVAALEILALRGEQLRLVVTHHISLNEIDAAMESLSNPNTKALKIAVEPRTS